MTEPLPCPFCGNDVEAPEPVGHKSSHSGVFVHCIHHCGAQGPKRGSVADAVERWNDVAAQSPMLDDLTTECPNCSSILTAKVILTR